MLFQLPSFLIFLILFAILLPVVQGRLRLPYVVVASLIFYAWWYPPYTLLLVGLVVLSWVGARMVSEHPEWLPTLIVVALMPLLLFKYTDFVLASLQFFIGADLPRLGWHLPLGISFVTFTIVSLLVDTTRRGDNGSPGFWDTAAYITFFPHLLRL